MAFASSPRMAPQSVKVILVSGHSGHFGQRVNLIGSMSHLLACLGVGREQLEERRGIWIAVDIKLRVDPVRATAELVAHNVA